MSYIPLIESSLASQNILDNGGFEVWQRGTSFVNSVAGSYFADRWANGNNGNTATFTVSKETSITDGSPSSLKWNLTSVGTTTVFRIYQYLNDFAPQLAGYTITLRARVRVDAGGLGFVAIRFNDNNGSSPYSSSTLANGTWETITVTRAIASNVTAITLEVNFNNIAGTAYLDNFMLVVGSTPVNYIPVNPQTDLARCQRFYEFQGTVANPIFTAGAGTNSDGSHYELAYPQFFSVTKRAVPTITLTFNFIRESSLTDAQASYSKQAANVQTTGFTVDAFKNIAGSVPTSLSYYWTASADF